MIARISDSGVQTDVSPPIISNAYYYGPAAKGTFWKD